MDLFLDWKCKKLNADILLSQFACKIGDHSYMERGGEGWCILNLLDFCWVSSRLSPELLPLPQCNIIALIDAVKVSSIHELTEKLCLHADFICW